MIMSHQGNSMQKSTKSIKRENLNRKVLIIGGDINDNNDFDNVNDNEGFLILCNDNESQKSDDLGYNGGEYFIG